ncbi:MAG: ribbon-helix-helix protein, CopG family [Patescibacteria group bacterium]
MIIRNTAVISISLPQEFLLILNQLTKKKAKTRSEVIKDMLLSYYQDQSWEQLFDWGRKTKEKFNIKSEEDIVKLIND